MTQAQFGRFCYQAVEIIRKYAPIDTGNLRYNGIKFERKSPTEFSIYVDYEEYGEGERGGIVPYMPFTNEPWLAKRWNGKQNPNERWWQDARDAIANLLALDYGGQTDDLFD